MTSQLCNVHVCRVAEEVSIAAHMLGGEKWGCVGCGIFFLIGQGHRLTGDMASVAGGLVPEYDH